MSTVNTGVSELSVTIDGRSKAKALPMDDILTAVKDFLKESGVSGSFKLGTGSRLGCSEPFF